MTFRSVQAFQTLPHSILSYLLELVLWSFAAQVGARPKHQGVPAFIWGLPPSPTDWAAELIFSCQEHKLMSKHSALSSKNESLQLFTQSP